MATFLFDETVFGPVKSRRFGVSLGINLLPVNGKVCTFDCLYCECGLNKDAKQQKPELPNRKAVYQHLETKLISMGATGVLPDVITFAGNGEPTIHPDFLPIVEDTILLRNKYAPLSQITVLSNSLQLTNPNVSRALELVDKSVLKLDSAVQLTFDTLNRPQQKVNVNDVVSNLAKFSGKVVLQTLFCSGTVDGEFFDNSTPFEVEEWKKAIKIINPESVMIYTFSRDTPLETLSKTSNCRLTEIANEVEALGVKVDLTLS